MNVDESDLELDPSGEEPLRTGHRNRDEFVEEMRIRLASRPLHGRLSAAGFLFPSILLYLVLILTLAAVALYLAIG
jgi:hypothetical protein